MKTRCALPYTIWWLRLGSQKLGRSRDPSYRIITRQGQGSQWKRDLCCKIQ